MNEKRPIKTEIVVAVISLVGSLVAAIIALQANHQATTIAAQMSHFSERQKPFLQRQVELYFEIVDITSRIANLPESKDRSELEARFWILYWGQLGIVEDDLVIKQMIDFGKKLEANAGASDLKKVSIGLATACRKSLSNTWNLDLAELDTKK